MIDSTYIPTSSRTRRRDYLLASGSGLWGAQIGQVAVPLTAVTTLHTGAAGTSLLRTTMTIPFLVLGLPVGAWLDRIRRRPVMIASDVVRGVVLISVPIAAWAGQLTMAQLWAVVLVLGLGMVFFDLGTQSFVKDVVEPGQLGALNARLATIGQLALIGAPPLAGWLAGVVQAPTVLLLTALGFLCSASWMSRVRVDEHPAVPESRRRLTTEVVAGLRFVWDQRVLRAVLLAGGLVNVATSMTTTVLPVLVIDELGWSQGQLGLFLGVGGVGGLMGALTSRAIARRLGAGRATLVIGVAVAPLAFALPLLDRPVPTAVGMAAWALVVYKIGCDAVIMTTFRQQMSPREMLGRVNAAMRVVFTGSVAIGSMLAGAVAAAYDTRIALAVAAVVLGCVWLPIACSPVPRLTSLDRE